MDARKPPVTEKKHPYGRCAFTTTCAAYSIATRSRPVCTHAPGAQQSHHKWHLPPPVLCRLLAHARNKIWKTLIATPSSWTRMHSESIVVGTINGRRHDAILLRKDTCSFGPRRDNGGGKFNRKNKFRNWAHHPLQSVLAHWNSRERNMDVKLHPPVYRRLWSSIMKTKKQKTPKNTHGPNTSPSEGYIHEARLHSFCFRGFLGFQMVLYHFFASKQTKKLFTSWGRFG